MQKDFPEALVKGYESKMASLGNHPKDRHVLAAALHSKARFLVTSNLRDFPASATRGYEVEVHSPGQFLLNLLAEQMEMIWARIEQQAGACGQVPEWVLARLAQAARRFVSKLLAAGLSPQSSRSSQS